MAMTSTLALLETLLQYGLLNHKQATSLPPQLRGRQASVRSLARAVLQRGWLNVYQINQVLVGRGRELVIGPYHVVDLLGQGGQSTVYKARHAADEFLVALKVIRQDLVGHPDAARQFLREMEAMARLNHPNIIQFLDADQTGGTFYCAMELAEGTDLNKHVRLNGPLPFAEACDYIGQAALGLQHAHEKSLIHRDIKPGNLFLCNDQGDGPVIKILDWGLAGLRPPPQYCGRRRSTAPKPRRRPRG
jgi:serine/threonine protein kinase